MPVSPIQCAYHEAEAGFTVPGIGKLVVADRKAPEGRNPATEETTRIPAERVLEFRVAKAAKDKITRPQ